VSINDYLRFLVDKSGSDLHLKVGGPAQARIDGELSEIHDLPVLKFDDTVRFAEEVLGPALLEKVRAGEEATPPPPSRASAASAWRCSASGGPRGW